MSVSETQLQNIAGLILNNDEAVEEIRNRYRLRMFDRFRTATPAQREIINAMMDNEQAFWEEFYSLLASIGTVNEEDGDQDTETIPAK
jgi:hypothetical protein